LDNPGRPSPSDGADTFGNKSAEEFADFTERYQRRYGDRNRA